MTSFRDSLTSGIRGAVCSYLATGRNYYHAIRGISPGSFFPWAAFAAAYRLACDREPPQEVSPQPPFTGGQCPVFYRVRLNINAKDNQGNDDPNVSYYNPYEKVVLGAITSIGVEQSGNQKTVIVRAQPTPAAPGGVTAYSTFNMSFYTSVTATVHSIVRVDNQPDNCGDPPPNPVPPPDNSTTQIDVTYNDNDGVEINVPVFAVFAPVFIDVNAELNIPIRLSFSPSFNASFNASFNFSTGDVNFNFSNTNVSGGGNTANPTPDCFSDDGNDPGVPDDVPTPTEPPPSEPPEDETQGVLRGVIVTSTYVADPITEIFQDENPNIFIPRLGNVQFLFRIGNKLAWSADIPVRNKRQFIPCPWDGGAIDVKGTPVQNVEFSLTKVYTAEQKPLQFLV